MGHSERPRVSSRSHHRLQTRSDALGARFSAEEALNVTHHTKLVHEGQYVAEVEVDLLYADEGWSPYLSLEDAYKLDDVREALREGDVESAAALAKVYAVTPVSL